MKALLNARSWAGCLALLLALVVSACGDNTATTAPAPAATTPARAATPAAPTTTAVTTAPATTAGAATTSRAATTSAATAAATTGAAVTTASNTVAPTTTAATASTTTALAAAGPTTYPLTITDDNKRPVVFEKAPARIVSLAPSNTELVFALGLGDRLVGVDNFSNYPPEATKIEKIGDLTGTNIEKIVALSPDLVLAGGITSPQLIKALEDRKLKVVVLFPPNLAAVVGNINLVGQIDNVPQKAAAVAAEFQQRLDAVAAKVKTAKAKPRIFYELDPSLYTVGPGSFIDDMIQKAGGQNIVTDPSNPFPQLNQEAVISLDPEVILLGDDSGAVDSPEKIMARPGWSNVSAVKNKRVYALTADIVNRPGPRAAQGVELIARALYPELFK